ncbi:TPA: phage antirepressor N-terminal domain-containing protein [Pasteurella multocida]|uniref:phage antirepressor N-terminal domain-containing protein n=1 Tax=Pasteurella multocida TaxID=747 RepID=UPI00294532B8|nr:phage antirepressor N-terminal domain-containing protein [Pasteurella multocida]MEB3493479.1 phage antirepressor N-terminal domain-containing protein [Pasteurella multocida]HDR1057122.1 phage antirepressor N-terminal domain-containing protein [Pasteurella multocida]HDR1065448.1 phage antirepressor N-terminal domain-containing protein [Pasteurella multocida]HDR1130499.1 phage antirepressor N-terminal domain-containing protein [Pasteurella multocida]HDR1816334.1 phage antirepressor N-terminal
MQTLKTDFLGQEITLIDNNGIAYVAMREIVLGIGLDWKVQHKKLVEQSAKFNCGHITTVAQDGKNREMLCMPIKKLNGWLFSINPNKVRSDLKERLENYQEECFLALWDYWTTGIARRDEVKNKTEAWQAKMADYKMRSSQKGKALNECKKEKAELEREFAAIQQMDLFLEI